MGPPLLTTISSLPFSPFFCSPLLLSPLSSRLSSRLVSCPLLSSPRLSSPIFSYPPLSSPSLSSPLLFKSPLLFSHFLSSLLLPSSLLLSRLLSSPLFFSPLPVSPLLSSNLYRQIFRWFPSEEIILMLSRSPTSKHKSTAHRSLSKTPLNTLSVLWLKPGRSGDPLRTHSKLSFYAKSPWDDGLNHWPYQLGYK